MNLMKHANKIFRNGNIDTLDIIGLVADVAQIISGLADNPYVMIVIIIAILSIVYYLKRTAKK